MDLERALTQRFVAAINKSIPKSVIIGPRWFRFNPSGRPADFQFVAMHRLAKAGGMSRTKTLQRLMKNLDLRGLHATARVTQKGDIWVTVDQQRGKTQPAKEEGEPQEGGPGEA